MKSTILLTIAIFLISAPAPDSKTISEFSAGFLLLPGNAGLLADQTDTGFEDSSSQPTNTDSKEDLKKPLEAR